MTNSALVDGAMGADAKGSVNQSVVVNKKKNAAPVAPTEMTKSQPYGQNMSLDNLGGRVGVSEKEILDQEDKDNYELASRKSELEKYQRQKPPTR